LHGRTKRRAAASAQFAKNVLFGVKTKSDDVDSRPGSGENFFFFIYFAELLAEFTLPEKKDLHYCAEPSD
jgi:hypothetical protein